MEKWDHPFIILFWLHLAMPIYYCRGGFTYTSICNKD